MQIHEDKRFQNLIEHMEALYLDGCTEEMRQVLEQLQTLAETEQDPIGLAAAYFYRDILSYKTPDSDTYMQYVKRSLKIAETKDIPYYQMKASNSLGIMYSELSDFHTSLEYYLSALHIAELHPEFCYASVVLNNVGNLFVWLEDYAEAVIYLERAYYKSIIENQNDKELIALILLNLIELNSNIREYEKAHEWEEKSRGIFVEEAHAIIKCINLVNEAKQFLDIGRTEDAAEKLRIFIKQSYETPDYIYVFRCCMSSMRLGILLSDFELCTSIEKRMKLLKEESTIMSFDYDYATVRVEYYLKFKEQLHECEENYYGEYYGQTQSRIGQLRNTYAKSLAVKIAFEEIKDENESVHLQNELLQKDVEKDIFTNLYNKVSTEKYVREAMDARTSDKKQALILIDIDLFKRISDNYGHGFGDKVIIAVAEIIESIGGEHKIAGRFGGDEFLLFLDQQDNEDEIKKEVELLMREISESIQLPDDQVKVVTLSIGICMIDSNMEFDEAFADADKALYRAKELGRNRYEISE